MKKSFTLMELIVVVVIIAILAIIGLPKFFQAAERGRSSEGANVLGSIKRAQLLYYDGYRKVDFSPACTNLDVTVANLKYFNPPVCSGAAKGGFLGKITRIGGQYTLEIYDNQNTGYGVKGLCCSGSSCPTGYTSCN